MVATTTAIAYPRDTPNKPDVCIVRLLISLYMPVDVNLDSVINRADILAVENSTYYSFDLSATSRCPRNSNLQYVCGREDENFDGFVNQLDSTAISQSAQVSGAGTRITCGGVYATAFSCGSSRRAPLTPVVDISLDSIVYFNNDGNFGAETSTRKRAGLESEMMSTILFDVEHLVDKVAALEHVVNVQSAELARKADRSDLARKADAAAFAALDMKVLKHQTKLDNVLDNRMDGQTLLVSRFNVMAGAFVVVAASSSALPCCTPLPSVENVEIFIFLAVFAQNAFLTPHRLMMPCSTSPCFFSAGVAELVVLASSVPSVEFADMPLDMESVYELAFLRAELAEDEEATVLGRGRATSLSCHTAMRNWISKAICSR